MKELYNNYYAESLSQSKSQSFDKKTLYSVIRKYNWNYKKFFLYLPPDTPILDLGCGLGQFLYYLQTSGFTNIMGIDISEDQIRIARQIQPNLNLQHVADTNAWLQEHVGRFGVIIMNDVLEHIPLDQLIPTMQAVYGALYSGGRVIIKTVNASYPFGATGRYIDLTHKTAFTQKSLQQLIMHCKFNQISCFQEEIGIYNLLFLLKKIIVYIVRGIIRFFVYFSESDWPNIISVNIIATAVKETQNND